ncbi:MAG: O-antigen ligase family protein [Anaerolineaceae bacterium]|nr:O-antigen ligase family protein [Anaerolineaceae bacterium]
MSSTTIDDSYHDHILQSAATVLMPLYSYYTRYRLLPIHAGILAVFASIPVWYRFPGAPKAYTLHYSTGFLIFWAMLWTVGWWLLAGLPGFRVLRRDKVRRWWALALLLGALWAFCSTIWGYTGTFSRSDVTAGAALQWGVAVLFALVIACVAPSLGRIITMLMAGLVWNSLLAFVQTGLQRDLGLRILGEFALNPAKSGISIVQAEGVRWLRPYGLLPHPNILAGFLIIGLLAALVWVLDRRRTRWIIGSSVFLLGLWALLLTFSRSAWLGFAVAGFFALPLILRGKLFRRLTKARLVFTTGVVIVTLGLFALLYYPFLLSRAGVGGESVELRSVADRNVYAAFAVRMVSERPITGMGMGNFPWRASYYLQFTAFDLRGEPVHQVLLLVWAELGTVGLCLLTAALIFGLEAALRRDVNLNRIALLAGVAALIVVGLFDHYPWTLPQFQAAWWGLLAAAGTPGPTTPD